jgi:hypothetical protein
VAPIAAPATASSLLRDFIVPHFRFSEPGVDASIQFVEWEGVKMVLETDICSDFRRIQMRQKTGAPSRCAAGLFVIVGS